MGRLAAASPSRANVLIDRHKRNIMEPNGLAASASDIYRYALMGLLDFLHLSYRGDRVFGGIVRVEGERNMSSALACGRGVLAFSAHYGAWELIPRAVALLGHRVGVVGRKLSHPALTGALDRLRGRPGVRTVDRGDGAAPVVRMLRENTAVGVLIDQDTKGVEGRFVDFLGRAAFTPIGPAMIAVRLGVPVVTLHIRLLEDSTYLLRIDERMDTEGLEGERGAVVLLERLNRRIGEWIREDPRQWIWFHERWCRRPDGDAGLR